MKPTITIRAIEPNDNPITYSIIRSVFEEYGINKPGTAYFDECLPRLYETYTTPSSGYFIAVLENEIIGGAGIFPTEGLDADTCELVKMYVLPKGRGIGVGQLLMNSCVELAQKIGYSKMYLETMTELKEALVLYKKNGFTPLENTLGNSGHHSCSLQFIKEL